MSENTKPTKRPKTLLQCDIFEDQFATMQAITDKTGTPRAMLVRQAIDLAYPPKKK